MASGTWTLGPKNGVWAPPDKPSSQPQVFAVKAFITRSVECKAVENRDSFRTCRQRPSQPSFFGRIIDPPSQPRAVGPSASAAAVPAIHRLQVNMRNTATAPPSSHTNPLYVTLQRLRAADVEGKTVRKAVTEYSRATGTGRTCSRAAAPGLDRGGARFSGRTHQGGALSGIRLPSGGHVGFRAQKTGNVPSVPRFYLGAPALPVTLMSPM
jgi:hypothetical protein